ncbi:hypothetical protein DDZ14_17005 [Maritimibacter sp. 55A14]|uniref:Hint domain-containing protein n=1 Tax=Maritimibacter sp. 55A14 TaxID=2174844 RepID=UPI000D61873F|nr:Hint domain-containing protein [Maritimibacter sp. 55A14]PWE29446.1 hypothetical protein DDZ14_17005 [Maritimibacter sp. 55A14]
MTYPFDPARGVSTLRQDLTQIGGRSAVGTQALARDPRDLPRRHARFRYLDREGRIADGSHVFPDTPELTESCAAFARGTLIATKTGPVAVEDLVPGDRVLTRDHGAVPLRWIGCTPINYRGDEAQPGSLRIMANALGDRRPDTDLVLHGSARVILRHKICAIRHGARAALVPARSLADGDSIIELRPLGSVELFNFAFDAHQIVTANGVETESYHPGPQVCATLGGEVHHHLAHIFPWMGGRVELFGALAAPRLTDEEAMALSYT